MNIVFISSIFPPESGGPATYVNRLSHDLNKKGHNIKVIALSEIERDKDDPFYIIRISKKGSRITRSLRLFIAVIKHGGGCRYSLRQWRPLGHWNPVACCQYILEEKVNNEGCG